VAAPETFGPCRRRYKANDDCTLLPAFLVKALGLMENLTELTLNISTLPTEHVQLFRGHLRGGTLWPRLVHLHFDGPDDCVEVIEACADHDGGPEGVREYRPKPLETLRISGRPRRAGSGRPRSDSTGPRRYIVNVGSVVPVCSPKSP